MTAGAKDDKLIFRKVSEAMNRDEKYLALSPIPPCGRGLWHHLLFGPHITPLPGLSLIGRAAMAEELGWSTEDFDEAFREVFAQGLAKADWEARVVWLPNAVRHNLPQSPNVVRSWRKYWEAIPDCALKLQAYQAICAVLAGVGADGKFLQTFKETCRKPSGKASAKPFAKALPKVCDKPDGKNDPKNGGNQKAESREIPNGEDPSQVVGSLGVARTGAHTHAGGADDAGAGTDGGWPQ